MSTKLVQIHFDFHGPFGAEMSRQLVELAEAINQEPGFIWKIWTANEANHAAGDIYLFRDEDTDQAYIKKHTSRLKHRGVEDVT
ncbi:monooxygenase, partial [Citrobacter freundii]|uniref:monooxygenase n=1 Tax=Citrobacter freundii TaxID=546 RepID=UPI000E1C63A4